MTDYAKRLDEIGTHIEQEMSIGFQDNLRSEELLEIARAILRERDTAIMEVYQQHKMRLEVCTGDMSIMCDCPICADVIPQVFDLPLSNGAPITLALLDELPGILSRQTKTEG